MLGDHTEEQTTLLINTCMSAGMARAEETVGVARKRHSNVFHTPDRSRSRSSTLVLDPRIATGYPRVYGAGVAGLSAYSQMDHVYFTLLSIISSQVAITREKSINSRHHAHVKTQKRA